MSGNTFGHLFRITTFGESHGIAVGVVIDGCPSGLALSEEDIQVELDRRRPGQSVLSTPRRERDKVEIFSGIFNGYTTGAPIMLFIRNKDARSQDYDHLRELFRPSHADYTYHVKYGKHRDWRGGGRSSARETLARVAAGAVARKFLKQKGISFLAYTEQIGELRAAIDHEKVTMKKVEAHAVRCPDLKMAEQMAELIKRVRREGDSLGGIVRGVIRGVPAGLGEPVFDKLHADLGKAILSINAVKGFEIGSGFAGAMMQGSSHNDEFYMSKKQVHTRTNHAGGVLGGISSGEMIHFRAAFKPVSTIMKPQHTVTVSGKNTEFRAVGRHDPCVVPRAVPVVEAMAALTIMDHYLRWQAYERT